MSSNKSVKRILFVLIPLFVLGLTFGIGAYYQSKANQLEPFNVNGSYLLGYNGTDENIIIPDSITTIDKNAFAGNSLIKSVIVPEGVTKIENGAFSGCASLEKVTLPDSLTEIGDSAFDGCINLSKINFGKNLYKVGIGAFSGCDHLADIDIDAENNSFVCENHALMNSGKSMLYQYLAGSPDATYRIPDGIREIRKYAFWGCDNLKQIEFTGGQSRIDQYAVANCVGLESVIINEPTREIAMGAFSNDINLKQIIMPLSITSIHDSAFNSVPLNYEIICTAGSFAENYALEKEIPYSYVGESAKLEYSNSDSSNTDETMNQTMQNQMNEQQNSNDSDSIQNNDTIISNDSSSDSGTLISTGNSQINVFQNNTNNNGTVLGDGKIVSDCVFVMIDDYDVLSSGNNSQNNNLSASKYGITEYAYYGQNSLTYFDFASAPENGEILEIGQLAFARTGLTNVKLPAGLKSIGYGAFYHCDNLLNIEIPDSVTKVDAYAFEYTPWFTNWKNSISNNESENFLIVGDGVLIGYRGEMKDIIIPEGVKYISVNAFRGNQLMESIVIPGSVIKIDNYAFANCTNLGMVNGTNSLSEAGILSISENNSFEQCQIK